MVQMLTFLVLGVLFTTPALAQVIQGCVSGKGALRVVAAPDDCKRKETAISWNVAGPPGMDGMDGADGTPGPEGPPGPGRDLRVFDATGFEVGLYLAGGEDVSSPWLVFMESLGFYLTMDARGNLERVPRLTVHFTEPNCEGFPRIARDTVTIAPPLTVIGPGSRDDPNRRFFYAITGDPTESVPVFSSLDSSQGVCNVGTGGAEPSVSAVEVPAEDLAFLGALVPPLYVAPAEIAPVKFTILISLMVLFVSGSASAEVVNACVKPKGGLRIVDASTECRGDETPLSWNVQGPQGDTGDAGMDGADGVPGSDAEVLRVFDVNGREVGLQADSTITAVLHAFVFGVGEVAVVRNSGTPLMFTVVFQDAACAGQAYVRAEFSGVVRASQAPFRYFLGDIGETTRFLEPPIYTQAGDDEPFYRCKLAQNGAGGAFGQIPATEVTAEDLGLPWPAPLYVAPAEAAP